MFVVVIYRPVAVERMGKTKVPVNPSELLSLRPEIGLHAEAFWSCRISQGEVHLWLLQSWKWCDLDPESAQTRRQQVPPRSHSDAQAPQGSPSREEARRSCSASCPKPTLYGCPSRCRCRSPCSKASRRVAWCASAAWVAQVAQPARDARNVSCAQAGHARCTRAASHARFGAFADPARAAGARCTGCTGCTRCSRPPGEGGGDAGHARHATDARRISQDVRDARDARDARHATNGTWHGNAGDAADDGRSSCEGWNAYYARHAWRCYAQDVRRFNLPTDVLSEEAQMYIIVRWVSLEGLDEPSCHHAHPKSCTLVQWWLIVVEKAWAGEPHA